MKCPKCDGEMEEGLLVDGSMAGGRKSAWVRGKELPSIKLTAFPPSMEITRGGERYFLTVYRCQACGYLESYAK